MLLRPWPASPRPSLSMKTLILLLSLLAALPISLTAADTATPSREAIEWCDIWISHANETNRPRVLLIGDSITRDYYPEVEKKLAGKAFVARLATSRFLADPVLLKEIALVLDQMRFDVHGLSFFPGILASITVSGITAND
jgi:hypothetical protein